MRKYIKTISIRLKEKNAPFLELLYIGETGIKILDWLSDKVHGTHVWFRSRHQMLKRMIFWGWKMRWSYDFDAHTIYEMLYHKLDRIYTEFRDHGHCMWNSNENNNEMRKLVEAKMLAKRLEEDKYVVRAFTEANKKFGYMDWFEKINSESCYTYSSTYEKTPKRAEMFRKGRDKIYRKQKEYEKKRFFYLVEKYINQWWD